MCRPGRPARRSRRGRRTTGRRAHARAGRTFPSRTRTRATGRTRSTSARCSATRSSSSCRPASGASRRTRARSSGSSPRRRCRRCAPGSPSRAREARARAEQVYLELSRVRCPRAELRPRARNAPMSTATLRDEVTDLLQRLIRVDTTNPPGNETAAAELLRDYLEANGVECELIAKVPERANLVARHPRRRRPVAPLPRPHRRRARRPGRVVGAAVLGRAAGRPGLGPRRARHEEPGRGERGRHRVARARGVPAERRPDLRGDRRRGGRRRASASSGCARRIPRPFAATSAINEGGGDRVELEDGRPIYQATVAEKMTAPFRLLVTRPLGPRVDAAHRRQRARQCDAR